MQKEICFTKETSGKYIACLTDDNYCNGLWIFKYSLVIEELNSTRNVTTYIQKLTINKRRMMRLRS